MQQRLDEPAGGGCQAAARPALAAVLSSWPDNVQPDDAATVATWATKTAWVREQAGGQESTATPDMRRYLMAHRLPPEFTSVWIARHQGRSNFGVYVAQIETTHQDDHWTTDRRRHVLICTMTFRGLSVLVRTDDGWGVPQMKLPEQTWRSFWPLAEALQWPPEVAATDEDVQTVAMYYGGWLRMPDVPVFNRDPSGWRETRRN
jgi:hypothetical protein